MGGMVVLASAASFHQQQQQQHHHHHHESSLLSSSSAAEPHPVMPLLAATPCLVEEEAAARGKAAAAGGIHLWQPGAQPAAAHHFHNHLPPNPNPNPNTNLSDYLRKPMPTLLDAGGILAGCGASAGGGTPTCQDCGNQAKKDCSHRRCRTCCKSRGFECSTHVKSTWVPAARRRERQLATAPAAVSAPKKPRLVASQFETASHTSNSNATPSRSFDTTSSLQDASTRDSLPRHVRAPAMFKCVRVTSIDDGEGEYAYHAIVRIGGRVFKGFLYGQGLDDDDGVGDKDHAVPNISALHLGNQNGAAPSSSPAAALQSDLFGGTLHYGNQIS